MTSATRAERPPLDGKRVLFVAAVTPAFTGNGSDMRCASLLKAMRAAGASIRLIIIPAYGDRSVQLNPEVAALCRAWSCVPDPKVTWQSQMEDWWTSARGNANPLWPSQPRARWRRRVERVLSESSEELLVVFRLSAFSFLLRQRIEGMPCWLDLDELDSAGRRRRAALAASVGNSAESERLEIEASRIEELERRLLKHPQWLSVASEVERRQLADRVQARAFVVPNAVQLPTFLPPRENDGGPLRCLFVGTFGHPPNADAVVHFCRAILPRLQKLCPRPVEFVVAGRDYGLLTSLEAVPGFRFLGWVEDLEPVYRDADIVVVPLRAGAGTRIKILEAFSFGRPVVSTPIGAEGLRVTPGCELLVASQDESFAQACATLLTDAEQQRHLTANALAFVRSEHSPDAVQAALS